MRSLQYVVIYRAVHGLDGVRSSLHYVECEDLGPNVRYITPYQIISCEVYIIYIDFIYIFSV